MVISKPTNLLTPIDSNYVLLEDSQQCAAKVRSTFSPLFFIFAFDFLISCIEQ